MSRISKKEKLHNILSKIYRIIIKRKAIVFDAPTIFQLKHFALVIKELVEKNDFDIYVTGTEPTDELPLSVKYIPNSIHLPLYRDIALFITTEFSRTPYWLKCPTVFFGHGIGPKLNYAGSSELNDFDFIFSPCQLIYETQNKVLQHGEPVKVGLPVLEEPVINLTDIENYFKIDLGKTTIVYAPSWSDNTDVISDIDVIINYLINLTDKLDINVIVSPHPHLFSSDRCTGKVFFKSVHNSNTILLNEPCSPFSTLDLVKISKVTISDISSILFEAMALDKLVILDGNKALYDYSGSLPLYNKLSRICHIPAWNNEQDDTLQKAIAHDEHMKDRQNFINDYIFNRGKSKEVFISHIYSIVSA